METGKVKWYDEVKGFGFIATSAGKDIFVHRSGVGNVPGGLQPDQEVTFETKEGERGLIAINVEIA